MRARCSSGSQTEHVDLFVRRELAVVHAHEVVGDDLGLALAVGVVRRADEAHDCALQAGLFVDLAQRALLERLALVDLALGEGPVAARLAIDAGDLDASAGHEASSRCRPPLE